MEYKIGDKVMVLPKASARQWVRAIVVDVTVRHWKVLPQHYKKPVMIHFDEPYRIRYKLRSGTPNQPNKIDWPEGHEDYLRNNYMDQEDKQLAKKFGVAVGTVRKKLFALGLKREEHHSWKPVEDDYLLRNYRKESNEDIAREMNRLWPREGNPYTRGSIEARLRRLKIRRTKEEQAFIYAKNRKRTVSRKSQVASAHWKRVKLREQLGMSIPFSKHRSRRKKTHTPVYKHEPNKHINAS